MAEPTAWIAGRGSEERAPDERPGLLGLLGWLLLAGVCGSLLASIAVVSPGFVGVAAPDVFQRGRLDVPQASTGAVVAAGAVLVVFVWAIGTMLRLVLDGRGGREAPAWTWTALVIGPAVVAAGTTDISAAFAGLVAGVALRRLAYRRDGSVRPDPLNPGRRCATVVQIGVPLVAIGVACAYTVFHPLSASHETNDELSGPIAVSTMPLTVHGPYLENTGGRPVRILAIEPGAERGYALHLAGVGFERRPFRPFTLAPHSTRADLSMTISRAGCTRGATGRIDSVRVRYILAGERTMLVPLERPLRLSC